jgi:O-antigen ligase
MLILLFHAIHDRLGLMILGSSIWGGRFYIWCLFGFVAYLVQGSQPIDDKAWGKLPTIILYMLLIDLGFAVVTALVPSLVEIIAPIYSGISLVGYQNEAIGVEEDTTGRIGAFGDFGMGILLLVLARYRISDIWRPDRFVPFMGILFGVVGVFAGGFRSGIANMLLLFVTASIRDLKNRAFLFIAIAVIGLMFLPVVNNMIPLPKQVQRGLVFLPGNWDPDMVQDADASNQFRINIWTAFLKYFFPEHPWIGRGFGFDPSIIGYQNYNSNKGDMNWDITCVATGSLHNGFFSVVDSVGVIGTFFFVAWHIVLIRRVFNYLYREDKQTSNPAIRYLALYLFLMFFSYWMGALSIGSYLVKQFVIVAAFNSLLLRQRELEANCMTEPNPEHPRMASGGGLRPPLPLPVG